MARKSNRARNPVADKSGSGDAQAPLAAPVEAAPREREKTLNELNQEARAIDREHARRREEAERLAIEAAGPLLEGTLRGRGFARRVQKPVRPPVTE